MAAPLQYLLNTLKVATSFLVIHKILKLFVNPLTADDKHYLLNRDNLTEPIQIQLSQNQKFLSEFFLSFLKSLLNLKH